MTRPLFASRFKKTGDPGQTPGNVSDFEMDKRYGAIADKKWTP